MSILQNLLENSAAGTKKLSEKRLSHEFKTKVDYDVTIELDESSKTLRVGLLIWINDGRAPWKEGEARYATGGGWSKGYPLSKAHLIDALYEKVLEVCERSFSKPFPRDAFNNRFMSGTKQEQTNHDSFVHHYDWATAIIRSCEHSIGTSTSTAKSAAAPSWLPGAGRNSSKSAGDSSALSTDIKKDVKAAVAALKKSGDKKPILQVQQDYVDKGFEVTVGEKAVTVTYRGHEILSVPL